MIPLIQLINLRWPQCINNLGLTQIVEEPTRVSINSPSTIDHVYVTEVGLSTKITVSKIGLSDHYPICASMNAPSKKLKRVTILR